MRPKTREAMVALIRQHFHLEGETVVRTRNGKSVMGNRPDSNGYPRARFGKRPGVLEPLHRIKFALLHGYIPEEVDHRNRNRGDLGSDNLRPATKQTNVWNAPKPRKNNLPRGVNRIPSGRYTASVRHGGRKRHLGTFDTAEQASDAYQEFCREHRGQYHLPPQPPDHIQGTGGDE